MRGIEGRKKRWRVRQGGEATHRYQEQLTVVYGDVSHTSLQPSFCSFSDAQAGCVSSPSVDAFERSQATREDKTPSMHRAHTKLTCFLNNKARASCSRTPHTPFFMPLKAECDYISCLFLQQGSLLAGFLRTARNTFVTINNISLLGVFHESPALIITITKKIIGAFVWDTFLPQLPGKPYSSASVLVHEASLV